jgi:hypothetical protein
MDAFVKICKFYFKNNLSKEKVLDIIEELEFLSKIDLLDIVSGHFTPEIHESIIKVWKNEYFKMIFKQYKYSLHISDGCEYLINKIVQINRNNYEDYSFDSKYDIYFDVRSTGFDTYHKKYGNFDILFFLGPGNRNSKKVLNYNLK